MTYPERDEQERRERNLYCAAFLGKLLVLATVFAILWVLA